MPGSLSPNLWSPHPHLSLPGDKIEARIALRLGGRTCRGHTAQLSHQGCWHVQSTSVPTSVLVSITIRISALRPLVCIHSLSVFLPPFFSSSLCFSLGTLVLASFPVSLSLSLTFFVSLSLSLVSFSVTVSLHPVYVCHPLSLHLSCLCVPVSSSSHPICL